jgi:putative DNA primase/helicase
MDNVDTAQQGGVVPVRPDRAVDVAAIPAVLRQQQIWLCWKFETRDGKRTKIPVSPLTGRPINATVHASCCSFEKAMAGLEARPDLAGVGFSTGKSGIGVVGIDLDGCIDEHGRISDGAMEIVALLDSYTELTPSRRGLRVLVKATKTARQCTSSTVEGTTKVEVYSQQRYFTATGWHLAGTPREINARQSEFDRLCAEIWPAELAVRKPVAALSTDWSDDEVVARIMRSAQGGKFVRLMRGDTSMHGGDHSRADLSLCSILRFRVGDDVDRIDRLFRRSKLYREKWDELHGDLTYGQMTIQKAIAGGGDTYSASKRTTGPGREGHLDAPRASGTDGVRHLLGTHDPASSRLILSPSQTLPTAKAYVAEFHSHPDGRTLVNHGGILLEWRSNRFVEIEEGLIGQQLQGWTHGAVRPVLRSPSGQIDLVDFEANPRTQRDALEAIKSFVHLPSSVESPSWLNGGLGRPDALDVLPCRSMNLHIPSGLVIPPTPSLFTMNSLDFDYVADAPPPLQWIAFLNEIFEHDVESINLLQDWFGYCLTCDTRLQKMLLIVGPRRSGKGTIGRVLTRLVGESNVVNPTTGALAGPFGLQPLVGKSLAIVSDARFGGAHIATVTERLLCISGEDRISIERKFLSAVSMRLRTRFMFLSNEIPRLPDASSALPGRFVVLVLRKSFFGSEDTTLTERLFGELPGILLWALEGWKRRHERGKFAQPSLGADALHAMEDLGSPVGAFIRERCVVGASERVEVDELFHGWGVWCQQNGHEPVGSKQEFGRDLGTVVPGLNRRRGTGQVSFYEGIGLCPRS